MSLEIGVPYLSQEKTHQNVSYQLSLRGLCNGPMISPRHPFAVWCWAELHWRGSSGGSSASGLWGQNLEIGAELQGHGSSGAPAHRAAPMEQIHQDSHD